MRDDTENVIVKKNFEFALRINEFAELLESQHKFVLANQLLKSRTSLGTNIREAQNSESKADFIHKMKIAAKEGDETEYWLLLCKFSKVLPFDESIMNELSEINKILNKIIASSKKGM
jgi:four helix bundle protein